MFLRQGFFFKFEKFMFCISAYDARDGVLQQANLKAQLNMIRL